MKFIGFYNYTVILTYLSLISSAIGMKLAYERKFGVAICCLVLSGICDMFDGVVARSKKDRTEDEKNFGIQLDSLCDIVCFGVFPAVFLYFSGVNTFFGIAALLFYLLCAVIRLAFFNVLETKRQISESGCAKSYRGLPVTSIAIILPFFYLLGLPLPDHATTAVYYILTVVTGALFISDFRVPKIDIAKILRKPSQKQEKGEALN